MAAEVRAACAARVRWCGDAALRQVAFLWRICFRLVMGRSARAPRRRLLPKLLSAIPFTPVRGRRLLGKDKEVLVDAALGLAREHSSLHVLFPAEEDCRCCSRTA
jgi:hypothetical protein